MHMHIDILVSRYGACYSQRCSVLSDFNPQGFCKAAF